MASSSVRNYTRPLSEVSRTLNLTNVVNPATLKAVKPDKNAESRSLEKRDGVDCLFPGPSGSAHTEDCNEICRHFLGNSAATVTIPPVDIVTWAFRTCQFGLANLDACRSKSVQLGRLTSLCQGMLAECVINGYDGYYDLSSDGMAAALTGDDAAPPYSQWPC